MKVVITEFVSRQVEIEVSISEENLSEYMNKKVMEKISSFATSEGWEIDDIVWERFDDQGYSIAGEVKNYTRL